MQHWTTPPESTWRRVCDGPFQTAATTFVNGFMGRPWDVPEGQERLTQVDVSVGRSVTLVYVEPPTAIPCRLNCLMSRQEYE